MFSPKRTPPPESSSDSEEDADLPTINVKTPEKLPKLDNEQSMPERYKSSPSKQGHVGSPAATACSSSRLLRAPSQDTKAADPVKEKFKSTRGTSKISTCAMSLSIADELKNLSPLKVVRYNKETNESKKTARKVKKLTKTLREKSEMERKASLVVISGDLMQAGNQN